MTREEAIALLNDQYETCKRIYDCSADQRKSYPNVPQFMEALDMALTSLHPVSREQVEKVWRGEWMFPIFGDQQDENDPRCQCSECGSIETPLARHRFCPSCGAPMTDEAVDMMLERWKEALGDEN